MNKKIIALLVILLTLGLSLACGGTGKTPEAKEPTDGGAVYPASQSAVKEEIASPATARFPPMGHHEVIIIKRSENNYRLTAFVESEFRCNGKEILCLRGDLG